MFYSCSTVYFWLTSGWSGQSIDEVDVELRFSFETLDCSLRSTLNRCQVKANVGKDHSRLRRYRPW